MSLLDWILGRKRDPPWLGDVRVTLGLVEEISRKALSTTLRIEETMSALSDAVDAVAQNVADVRAGVEDIIARLNDGAGTEEATAALTKLAADLQGVEDSIAAATAEPEPEPEPPVEP